MKTLRPLLAAALAVSFSLLAACGGDDGEADAPPTSAAPSDPVETAEPLPEPTESDAGEEPPIPLIPGEPCDTEVTITGEVEAQWSTEGAALVVEGESGPPATYQSAEGQNVVTAYSEGNGFELSVILTAGTDSYGTSMGAAGIEAAADGSGATIDADLVVPGTGEPGVHVTATFAC